MWKYLHNAPPLFIKFIKKDSFEILITDFVNIWTTKLTKSEFLDCLKRSNPRIKEFKSEDSLLEKGINLLSVPDKLKVETKREDGGKTLWFCLSVFVNFSFNLECRLIKGSDEFNITQPLLKTVNDLHTSETKLRNMLIEKDTEIEKYKAQNVDVAFYLKTDVFNNEAHLKVHKLYEDNFGQSELPEVILERVIEIPEQVSVKEETFTDNIKIEPSDTFIKSEPDSNTKDYIHAASDNIKRELVKTESGTSVNGVKRKRRNILDY